MSDTMTTHDSASDQGAKPEAPARRSLGGRLLGLVPTALVVVLLGGVAVLGHHTGWKMPSLSELTGSKPSAEADWCEEHAVPESICVECNKGGLPDSCKSGKYGWCDKHGVQDCPLCHPDVAQTPSPVNVTEAMLQRANDALAFKKRPENAKKCTKHLRLIQFASVAAADKAGIKVEPAGLAAMTESVSASGEIIYDQTSTAHLSSRAAGAVWQVDKQVGDRVKKGELMALIDAAEVGRLKADFLQAFAQLDVRSRILEQQKSARGAIPERVIQESEASVREARVRLLSAQQALVNMGLPFDVDKLPNDIAEHDLIERLRFLGLPAALARSFDAKTTTANLLPIKAPLDGIVVERHVVSGEVVDTSDVLFVVADTSNMWLTLDVRLEDADAVKLGQTVKFKPDGTKEVLDGKITWISTAADAKTRTVKVRAELPNPDGKLRNQTFGTGEIIERQVAETIVVPNSAVHNEGDCNVVFVRDKHFMAKDAPKIFHVRTVRTGAIDDKNTEIIAGVLPNELVATEGSGILRSELLKNNLGAG